MEPDLLSGFYWGNVKTTFYSVLVHGVDSKTPVTYCYLTAAEVLGMQQNHCVVLGCT